MFVLPHSVLGEAHTALRLGILYLGMRGAGRKSNTICPAPGDERLAEKFIVCADEFELFSACCDIILDALEKSLAGFGGGREEHTNPTVIIRKNEAVGETAERWTWKSADAIDVEALAWADVGARRKSWMCQILGRLFHSAGDAERAWSAEFNPLWESVGLRSVRVT
jgi:hypothetical protein